jgi:hypothetical protein
MYIEHIPGSSGVSDKSRLDYMQTDTPQLACKEQSWHAVLFQAQSGLAIKAVTQTHNNRLLPLLLMLVRLLKLTKAPALMGFMPVLNQL